MVSPQNPTNVSEFPTETVRTDRGFVAQETVVPAAGTYRIDSPPWQGMQIGRFWGPVIAGSLFVISLFVMSWCLMFACHVGTVNGMVRLGAGSAWWTGITAAIAFYCGSAIAANIYGRGPARWMRGAAVWALTIPLALCIWGFASSGLLVVNTGAHAGGIAFGAIWTAFWSLLVGLVFSLFGGGSTFTRQDLAENRAVTRP